MSVTVAPGSTNNSTTLVPVKSNTIFILLLIYSKSDQEDVTAEDIKLAINEFQKEDDKSRIYPRS
ncbi:hypothetical protein RIVM261_019220 [Rivularia sp. IAM M-261]|nr:hypothetical protein RIVM261_019220 [Rivularia sp. IAM M-261]